MVKSLLLPRCYDACYRMGQWTCSTPLLHATLMPYTKLAWLGH